MIAMQPTDGPLQKVKDEMAKGLYGITATEAISQGICIDCRKPALPNCYSQAGLREYKISGLCEKCFDKIMENAEDCYDELTGEKE